MSEMPTRMISQWVKEEILDAISDRFSHCLLDGMTLEEENAFRLQQRRIAKFFGLEIKPTEPAGFIEKSEAA